MKIKAVALDMDGTLLNSERQPSERTKEYLLELEKNGVEIIIATGRSFSGAEHIIKKMGLKSKYLVCYNGAEIMNHKDDSLVYEQCLDGNTVKELIEIADNRGIHINLYQDEIWYVDKEDSEETQFYAKKCGLTPAVRPHDSFEKYDMPKVIFIGEHERLLEVRKEIEAKLGHRVNTSFSSRIFLEVMDKKVNKGMSLSWLLNHLGLDKNECAAFGDAENDLSMLQAVKYGVAMGNSTDELKSKVPYTTVSNDEDGIVHFFEMYK